MIRFIAALFAVFLLASCQSSTGQQALTTSTATVTPGSCHARTEAGQILPDPHCTPGALNPAVTQANIDSTICARGWASAQRARYFPLSLSSKVKRQVEDAYGVSHSADAEGDHLTPIELGGLPGPMPAASSFTLNFWPERNDHPKPGFLNSKDIVENDLNHAVCSGRVALAAAQRTIASDWVTAEHVLGLR